ncbi:MAG: urease accessory protein UreD [Aquificaceae bacterium]|nr:urease accessory protein UreD [Aquificaceae bacterium]
MRVIKPFYLKDTLLLQIVSIGAGLSERDFVSFNIEVGQGCKVLIINQGATKIMKSVGESSAQQLININVDKDARLEYLPGLTIPFPKSNFYQAIEVNLSPGSEFGYMEIFSMGRVASLEDFMFSNITTQLIVNNGNVPAYFESFHIEPKMKGNMAVIGEYNYILTGLWTFNILDSDGIEEFDGGVLTWGWTVSGFSFIKGFSKIGNDMISKACHIVDDGRDRRGLEKIPWRQLSSAFL